MTEEMKNNANPFDEMEVKAPELSFESALEGAAQVVNAGPEGMAAAAAQAVAVPKEQENLTAEELAQVDKFVKEIDLTNSQAVMNYGVGTQQKIADFSQKALENVKTKDLGDTGDMISDLVGELKTFNTDEEEKGLFGFFKKKEKKMETLKAKYSKVETNVTTIKNELESRQIQLLKDNAMLDQMYEMNQVYFKELSMYILAGKKKLEEVRSTTLVDLQQKAEASGLPEDAQAAQDMAAMCDRFEKKIYDLQLTRNISLQTAPQIRMVQSSNTLMAEKIQSTIVNTIPLWKNQMVIAMGVEHSMQAAKAQKEVSEMTNELLKKNADKLQQATIETVKESERGIIDIETLQHTNQSLIDTLNEVLKIQDEGREKRAAAEAELASIETQLRQKMLEASRAN